MRPLDRLHIYFPRNAVSQACLAAAEQFVQFVVVHARQHVASDGPAILANIAAGPPAKTRAARRIASVSWHSSAGKTAAARFDYRSRTRPHPKRSAGPPPTP